MSDLLKHVRESGFSFSDRLIQLFVGGSELHGAKVHGTDDLDIYGVYIEPPDRVLGLESMPHFVWSTAGADRRNGPNDVDVTLYSLKKWAGLACKGNPRRSTSYSRKTPSRIPSGTRSSQRRISSWDAPVGSSLSDSRMTNSSAWPAKRDAARRDSDPKSKRSRATT